MLNFLNKNNIEKIVNEKFSNVKIAVIGDLMLDQYLWGGVSRISPEAPVPVVKVDRKTCSLGGAGNVAHNLVTLGCQTRLIGVVGTDTEADLLRREMLCLNIPTDGLVPDPNRPTTIKTRVISGSQQLIRLDNEFTAAVNQEIEQDLLERSIVELDHVNLVILSDYSKGGID